MTTINNAVFLSDDEEDESFHNSDVSLEGSSSDDEQNEVSDAKNKACRKKLSFKEAIIDRKVDKIYSELLDEVRKEFSARRCTVNKNDYMLEFQKKSFDYGEKKNANLNDLLHYVNLGVSKVFLNPVEFDISRYKRISRSMNDEMENDTKMLVEKALGSMNEKGIRYVDKKVRYAGETFVLRERVGIDGSSSGTATKKPRKIPNSLDNGGGNTGGMAALDEIVSKITKYAGINSIQKSQSDWSEFRQISGLESQLEKQRKYGYISKTAFLQKTDWKLHEKELELRKKVDSNNRNI